MKIIKKFNEIDSWAGSLYAYKNPIIPSRGNDSFEMPLNNTKLYICEDCNVESRLFDNEILCANCGSENLQIL